MTRFFLILGGYYTVMTKYNIRIVALNTILYYKPNKAVKTNGDPAGQFEWLTSVLSNAARNKERVNDTNNNDNDNIQLLTITSSTL